MTNKSMILNIIILLFSFTASMAQDFFMVKDIMPGFNGSDPHNLIRLGSKIVFRPWHNSYGYEWWISDGSEAGTHILKDIWPGVESSMYSSDGVWETAVNNILYFVANDNIHGGELWKTDGSADGTMLVKDIFPGEWSSDPRHLINVAGTLYFIADDGTSGAELWKSDGTEAGTIMIKDINPGGGSTWGNVDVFFAALDDVLYFNAVDTLGRELWRSDGTPEGTYRVKDIQPGPWSSDPGHLAVSNGNVFFIIENVAEGLQLWKSDGTESGTVLVKLLTAKGLPCCGPYTFIDINGILFFNGRDSAGYELWKSDGTTEGTVMVKDINIYGDGIIGTPSPRMVKYKENLVFVAYDEDHGLELWKSDGTTSGTQIIKDINPGYFSAFYEYWDPEFTIINDILFFQATGEDLGDEVWKTDGTAIGTTLVADIRPGYQAGSAPRFFTEVDGNLYLNADDGEHGAELWRVDLKLSSNRTTIITHGFTLSGSDLDESARWTLVMADSIMHRLGAGHIYEIDSGKIKPYDSLGTGGENIVVFDWLEESNRPLFGYAEGAGDALAAKLISGAVEGKWSLENIHFIGHSRGAVVCSEAIQRMGLYASVLPDTLHIDDKIHFTLLDAHPWDNRLDDEIDQPDLYFITANDYDVNGPDIDRGVVCWDNVAYADNYWHSNGSWNIDLDGLSSIPGCTYNEDLSSQILMDHPGVHAWYHATIPFTRPDTDWSGSHIDSTWFTSEPARQASGFNLSLSAAGNNAKLQTANTLSIDADRTFTRTKIFNGDFKKRGWYGLGSGEPGWELQGGGGKGKIANHAGGEIVGGKKYIVDNAFLKLDRGNESKRHNFFYIPSNVSTLWYRIYVAQRSGDDELRVLIGDTEVDRVPLHSQSSQYYFEWRSVTVSNMAGSSTTLTYEIDPHSLGVQSTVWIDDVGFERTNNYIIASVASPVQIHAFDVSGNYHTGPTSDSTWESTIPGSDYFIESDSVSDPRKTIILPRPTGEDSYIFKFESENESGHFSFQIEDVTDSLYTTLALFDSVGIQPATTALCSLRSVNLDLAMFVDLDNNGDYDQKVSPTILSGIEIEYSFKKGWNLISLPAGIAKSQKSQLFPMATSSAFRFDHYYLVEETLKAGRGYWLKFDSTTTVTLSGLPILVDTIQVKPGWNLIGGISDTVETSAISTIPAGIINSNYFGYDSAYYSTNVILPNNGYWVKTRDSGKIIIPATFGYTQAVKKYMGIDGMDQLQKVQIRDSRGNQQNLYYGTQKSVDSKIVGWELPPKPPAGAFDVRFVSNRAIEILKTEDSSEYPIEISSTGYPITIIWDQCDQSLSPHIRVGNDVTSMQRDGSIVIDSSNSLISLLIVSNSGRPKEYRLYQSYPNPFNPVTKIEYDLPGDSRVQLKIFDIIGREIEVLVDIEQQAGVKTINWNASEYPSGIYFYRLEASDIRDPNLSYTDVRKMILLK